MVMVYFTKTVILSVWAHRVELRRALGIRSSKGADGPAPTRPGVPRPPPPPPRERALATGV